jgi:hypothetical protein
MPQVVAIFPVAVMKEAHAAFVEKASSARSGSTSMDPGACSKGLAAFLHVVNIRGRNWQIRRMPPVDSRR